MSFCAILLNIFLHFYWSNVYIVKELYFKIGFFIFYLRYPVFSAILLLIVFTVSDGW